MMVHVSTIHVPARVVSASARAAPRMLSSEELAAKYPHAAQTPIEVVKLQMEALQQGNEQIFWRFVSPEAKRATGILRPADGLYNRRPYVVRPDYCSLPLYQPMIGSLDFKVVGALSINEDQYQCRARVWPTGVEDGRESAGGSIPMAPIEYIWALTLQPLTRPSCYEDAPVQQGISTGPSWAGCWLVDAVQRDDRWRGDDEPPKPNGLGGGPLARRMVVHVLPANSRDSIR